MNIRSFEKRLDRYRRNLRRRISRSMRANAAPTQNCRRLQRKLGCINQARRALRGSGI
jgi:hypothetical protein